MEQLSDMPQRQRIFERAFSFKGRIKRAEFALSYVDNLDCGWHYVDECGRAGVCDRVKRCHDLG